MTMDPIRNYIEPFAFSAAVLLKRPGFPWGDALNAPFPAFGGKSRVAAEVWRRFVAGPGEVGAIETINDRNVYVSNFWRAVSSDPDAVAHHADWPVIEADLHARHRWLVTSDEAQHRLDRVREDPEYYDARIAGWWCWGACAWIGSGWCDETHRNSASETRPALASDGGGAGVLRVESQIGQQLPRVSAASGQGVHSNGQHNIKRRPRLAAHGQPGTGVHSPNERQPAIAQTHGLGVGVVNEGNLRSFADHRPQLADQYSRGRGVHGNDRLARSEARSAWIRSWMNALRDRLRSVRTCCGHWSRVCDSPSTMTRLGLTGVFLDPPYRTTLADGTANRTKHIYANDRHQDVNALCDEVQEWCLRWGNDPMVRVALCGLEGEYPAIERAGWDVFAWKSNGGYGNRGGENANAARERIWFSPHCAKPDAATLFSEGLACG